MVRDTVQDATCICLVLGTVHLTWRCKMHNNGAKKQKGQMMVKRAFLAEHEGVVVRGKQLGRALGVPTANILYQPGETGLPDGVYVGDLVLMDQGDRAVQGVLNQGRHPTVPGGLPSIEIHLFDFDEVLYGQRVRVRYLSFIRPEAAFESKEAMRLAVMEDIRTARQWFLDHQNKR
jgi:FAD synthase